MKTLKVGRKKYQLPESADEVPSNRWRDIARGLVRNNRVMTFCALAGLPIHIGVMINEEQWLALLPEIEWLQKMTSEKQPVEFIQLSGERYYLPADGMEFSPIIEYVMAEDALWRFMQDGDRIALSELFFTLCRPKNGQKRDANWSGDVRERYNAALVQQRAKTVHVPGWSAYLLLMYFAGVKYNLNERYPELFGSSPEISEQDPRGIGTLSPAVGWLKVIKALAEKGIYGNYEDVCYTFMHTVMLNLSFDMENQHTNTKPVQVDELE
jgi:hypothetical protein